MNTAVYIAKRYFFSKKSQNVINITSAISVLGIFISTCAMVIVLSGFNGIEQLVKSLYSSFDADVQILPKVGKTYDIATVDMDELRAIEGVAYAYEVIEEIAMVKRDEQFVFATMKGVSSDFFATDLITHKIVEGQSEPSYEGHAMAILGVGLQDQLQVSTKEIYDNNVIVYGLLRNKKLSQNNKNAFKQANIEVGGIFQINPEFDNAYFIVPMEFAKDILEYENYRSSIEIVLKDGYKADRIKEDALYILGKEFKGKTRYEQNELIFKTNEAEKWMVFIILGFILLVSTFNIIASLTMLILDKKKDIKTLISMGATSKLVRQIFFLEGLFINFLGGILGVLVGVGICWVQIEFKIITLEQSVIDYWPVIIQWKDIALITLTIFSIGIISSYFPVSFLIKKHFKSMFNR